MCSEHHGVAEVGRDLWRSSAPTSEQQGHVQSAPEYLQEQRLHNLSGQPVPVFDHLHSELHFPNV